MIPNIYYITISSIRILDQLFSNPIFFEVTGIFPIDNIEGRLIVILSENKQRKKYLTSSVLIMFYLYICKLHVSNSMSVSEERVKIISNSTFNFQYFVILNF